MVYHESERDLVQRYELPPEYRMNPVQTVESVPFSYWTADRLKKAALYQWHVYAWARELIGQSDIRSVLDLGCGPGVKLARLIYPYVDTVYACDQKSALTVACQLMPNARLLEVDLEHDVPPIEPPDLLIACDVIEHLSRPDAFLKNIRSVVSEDTHILISTPDRARLHGACSIRPTNPFHVMEWTSNEFTRFLAKNGFTVLEERHLSPLRLVPSAVLARTLLRQISRRAAWHYNFAVLCRAGN